MIRVRLENIRKHLGNSNDAVLEAVAQIENDVAELESLPKRFREQVAEAERVVTLDLNQIVRKTLEKIKSKSLIPLGVEFEVDLAGDLPVSASAYGVEKVTENLVRNALEALEAGGKIGIKTRMRFRGAQPMGSFAELEVSDTGIGMDEHALAHIFEPGFSTKEARRGGMGFGLFWVKIFLDRFRGDISVKSEPGVGTMFFVWLPIADLAEDGSKSLADDG